MVEQPIKEENLFIIKELETNPAATQRVLSDKLGISLGKTNYLLKALIKKGFIKVHNFSHNPGKIQKINYYLTKHGLEEKIRLMRIFLKKKEAEYNFLKQEWEAILIKQKELPDAKK
ncbi:MAG: MarR family EPS-associated transcriptional regulator [Candidatus Omnitrophota bacterium]